MSTLESYLTTIADAIREKKGTTEPINASNFASEILSIQGGGSLNVAYSLTPPTDTSKIWLQCAEPSSVEVKKYLDDCTTLSNVANYGVISNPVSGFSSFYGAYFNTCYIGNNQIAIVGYNHIRIFDLTSKNYIADYTISVGTNEYYSNVIYKDNILYFAYDTKFCIYNLSTQTLTTLSPSVGIIKYMFFKSDNVITVLGYNNGSNKDIESEYNIVASTFSIINNSSSSYFSYVNLYDSNNICINNIFYNFYYYVDQAWYFKYSLISNTFSKFESLENFAKEQGWTQYRRQSLVYDGERYVYLIGGNISINGASLTPFNDIVRYDVINDTFEKLGISLLGGKVSHFSLLIDNRAYIFGGNTSNGDTRPNQIDYFDISYPLNQNNCIITTNTVNTDNALPLINTEKLKLNSNIASAYLGNSNNLAEKVNVYYWNGTKWVGINCEDYVESSGTGGGLGGGGDATTDPEIPVDKPVEI